MDCDLFEKERQLYGKRLLNDGLIGAGLDLLSDESPPCKRTCRDPLEDRIGWQPLLGHVSTRFSCPQQVSQEGCIAVGRNRKRSQNLGQVKLTITKPPVEGNVWQKKCAKEEKSTPATSHQEQALGQNGGASTAPATHRGHLIPCYSMDIDRERDCFRPEIISLASFPKPPP